MQLVFELDDRAEKLAAIHRRLISFFGRPVDCFSFDPVSQLVLGMVGGRTQDKDSKAAFKFLLNLFVSWEQLRDARVDTIFSAIQTVTFAEKKAHNLKASLQIISDRRGTLTLDFLSELTTAGALQWLETLPGVGRKTSATVLNFSTQRRKALVIDTHHLRILARLGLIRSRADAREAYDKVVPRLPEHWTANDFDHHHRLFKQLGQSICRFRQARCARCPIAELCASCGAA